MKQRNGTMVFLFDFRGALCGLGRLAFPLMLLPPLGGTYLLLESSHIWENALSRYYGVRRWHAAGVFDNLGSLEVPH